MMSLESINNAKLICCVKNMQGLCMVCCVVPKLYSPNG